MKWQLNVGFPITTPILCNTALTADLSVINKLTSSLSCLSKKLCLKMQHFRLTASSLWVKCIVTTHNKRKLKKAVETSARPHLQLFYTVTHFRVIQLKLKCTYCNVAKIMHPVHWRDLDKLTKPTVHQANAQMITCHHCGKFPIIYETNDVEHWLDLSKVTIW